MITDEKHRQKHKEAFLTGYRLAILHATDCMHTIMVEMGPGAEIKAIPPPYEWSKEDEDNARDVYATEFPVEAGEVKPSTMSDEEWEAFNLRPNYN